MSIDYYDDLHFIGAQEMPRCQATIDRTFGPTIALNLLWRGRIHFAMDGGPSSELAGPLAYWTWDGPRFFYGKIPDRDWHQLWVHAGGERARRMLEGGLVPVGPQPWAKPESPEKFLLAFRRLIALVNLGRASDQAERVQLLEKLFLEAAMGRSQSAPSGSLSECIAGLSERIAAEPTRAYDFAYEARLLNVSYHHFRRLFSTQIGRPPHAYLVDCRMRWAANRLTAGAESVKAVAYEAGFSDPRAFARQFRNRNGVAPHALLTEELA